MFNTKIFPQAVIFTEAARMLLGVFYQTDLYIASKDMTHLMRGD